MDISNKNIKVLRNKVFIKQSSSSQGTLTEYKILEYLAKNTNLKVPSGLKYDKSKNLLQMDEIEGVLLITLLRNLEKLTINLSIDPQKVNLIQRLILLQVQKDLEVFHSHTDNIVESFDKDITFTRYPYTMNLMATVEIISQYIYGTSRYVIQPQFRKELKEIGEHLEANSKVLYRDPGLYNLLTQVPNGLSEKQWLSELITTKVPDEVFREIYRRTVHIDFETAWQFVCPEDDLSFILGSSINHELPIIPDKARNNTISYLSTIYRYLRVAARHAEYLFEEPNLYKTRYEHYGSIRDESPLYFLGIVTKVYKLAAQNMVPLGVNTQVFIEEAMEVLKKKVEDSLCSLETVE